MWQRLSKARSLWRLGVAALKMRRVLPHVDGLEWRDTDVRAVALASCTPARTACRCRRTRADARQHKITPHRLAMNEGRCLLVRRLRANAHAGGARIRARSRMTTAMTSKGRPQCRQTNAGARVGCSQTGLSTPAASAVRAVAKPSRRLPLASSP